MEDIRRTFLFTSSNLISCLLIMFQFQAEMSFYRGKPALGSQCCKDLIYKSPTCERLTSDRGGGGGGGWRWGLPRKVSICFYSLQVINISPTGAGIFVFDWTNSSLNPSHGKSICPMDVWRECEEKHRFYFSLTTEHHISVFDDYSFW